MNNEFLEEIKNFKIINDELRNKIQNQENDLNKLNQIISELKYSNNDLNTKLISLQKEIDNRSI